MKAAMPAGQRRHPVMIQRAVVTQSPVTNETLETWEDYARAWAAIEPLGSIENWREQQVAPEATHGVTLGYVPGLTSHMRIEHRGRHLNILSIVDREEREIEHLLQCKEET